MQQYFNRTSGLLYSYLICLPLLLLYELLILISQPQAEMPVRISVDVWFKSLFHYVGLDPVSTTLFAAAIVGGVIVYKKKRELSSVNRSYFLYMIAEATVYAVVVAVLISMFLDNILLQATDGHLAGLTRLQLIALSLGAGLYEELFFRVILVGLLVYLFNNIFSKKQFAYGVAVVLAALIFSAVHYVGPYGDVFTLNSFLFRFLFGLALNLIYVIRGFGMAAWTHAIYDIIVVMHL
jgi:membrane protease YdiL (CAAX protease family)